MRIRTRLLILILAILVPTFSAATLAVGYVYLEERRAQENSVKEAVRAFALLVDNELETREGILHALASFALAGARRPRRVLPSRQAARADAGNHHHPVRRRTGASCSTPGCRWPVRCRTGACPISTN
jgi:hypothetical protein